MPDALDELVVSDMTVYSTNLQHWSRAIVHKALSRELGNVLNNFLNTFIDLWNTMESDCHRPL